MLKPGLVWAAPSLGPCAHLQGLYPERGVLQASPSGHFPVTDLTHISGFLTQLDSAYLLSLQVQQSTTFFLKEVGIGPGAVAQVVKGPRLARPGSHMGAADWHSIGPLRSLGE